MEPKTQLTLDDHRELAKHFYAASAHLQEIQSIMGGGHGYLTVPKRLLEQMCTLNGNDAGQKELSLRKVCYACEELMRRDFPNAEPDIYNPWVECCTVAFEESPFNKKPPESPDEDEEN